MDVILLDELSSKIDELNYGLSSSIELVDAKIDVISSDLSDVSTNVAINNTASTTGTLSQKLTAIYNQIGSTNSSGGSSTNGSIMSKLNSLLTPKVVTSIYKNQNYSYNSSNRSLTVCDLSNVEVYGIVLYSTRYSSDYSAGTFYVKIDGTTIYQGAGSFNTAYIPSINTDYNSSVNFSLEGTGSSGSFNHKIPIRSLQITFETGTYNRCYCYARVLYKQL